MSTSKLLAETREPWADDFDSFRESISNDLPSPMETRQILLASSRSDLKPRKENKLMSLMRQKPLATAAVLALAMLVLVPAAYAVVNKLFLTVDPQQSEEEIKESLEDQLSAAGLSEAKVYVEKNGDSTKIVISAHDDEGHADLRAEDIEFSLGGNAIDSRDVRFAVAVKGELSNEDQKSLNTLVSGEEFAALAHRPEGLSDEEYATSLEEFFGENGFMDVDAFVEGERTIISVTGGRTE